MSRFTSCRSFWLTMAVSLPLLLLGYQEICPSRAGAAQTPDEGALRPLAEEFYARYANEDLDGFISLWSASSPERAARQQAAEKFFASHEKVAVSDLTIRQVAVEGDRGKARVELGLNAVEAKTGKPASGAGRMRRVLEFVREGAGWKVWREASAAEDLAAALAAAKTEEERGALLAEQEAPLMAELPSALNRLGTQQRTQGKLADALNSHRLAGKIAEQIGDRTGLAYALTNIGVIERRQGDFAAAIESQRKSLALFEAAGDKQGAARAWNGIALSLYGQGDYHLALEAHQKSLALAESAGSKEGISISLNNLGLVHKELGNHALALEFYQKSLALSEGLNDREGIGAALANIGNIHRTLGDYEQALKFQGQALKIKEEIDDKPGVANSLNDIGNFYRLRGDYAKALEHLEKSWEMRRSMGDKGVSGARTLNSIGHVHFEQGDDEKALKHYNEALALSEAQGNKDGITSTLYYIGRVLARQGNFPRALEHGERALEPARQTNSRASLLDAHLLIGEARRGLKQFIEARRAFEEAAAVSESLRTGFATQETRASYFARLREAHEKLIDLLMQMHGQSPAAGHAATALHVAERARARSLLDALAEAQADIRAGVDPALVERERTLQQQLNARAERQTRLLGGKHTAEQAAAIEKEIAALAAAYREVQAEIRRASPRYAALTQPRPLTPAEIRQRVLDRDTALLQYALGEEKSYLWAVTPDALWSYELPKRAHVEAAARPVRDLLADTARWSQGETAEAEYERAALALSRMLLPDGLLARLRAKRLAVVADGMLQYIPFGALPVPERDAGGARRRGGTRFLIADHEIVKLPSASTLAVLRAETAGRARAAKTVAVFADPVFDARDERVALAARAGDGLAARRADDSATLTAVAVGRGQETEQPPRPTPKLRPELARAAGATGIMREGGQGLTRLPFSRREAEMITTLVPAAGQARKALDFEASRGLATSDELANYRFVHFATHGILNSEHPELSGVVLSLIDERGRPVDGFLRLNEIYNLRLPAELVVLSACQTALGREVRGEGFLGLVRGFMYAGSPRVVASLWKVDDRATAELMRRFYEGMLGQNLRPAAALRRAKVEMLREERWRAPFQWAAFELQGEWK